VLNLVSEELGRLIGGALVSGLEPGPEALSPRQRQTLTFLIEGDSEKQAAARLGVSYATAHQYVTSLHRFFNVRSRGELMSVAMKRLGSGRWKEWCK
jgi:DNA-binding CsgD family transcriptional regulator